MWTFEIVTGKMLDPTGEVVGIGYSGAGLGKNNPAMQNVHDVGPIPEGRWTIGTPVNTRDHGPFAMSLIPDPSTVLFDRSAFLIHGDSFNHPGNASEGCIIMSRDVRERIWASGDRDLEVVSGYPNPDINGEISV